jgi:hypothetical protein
MKKMNRDINLVVRALIRINKSCTISLTDGTLKGFGEKTDRSKATLGITLEMNGGECYTAVKSCYVNITRMVPIQMLNYLSI